jgi:hypothetical protein
MIAIGDLISNVADVLRNCGKLVGEGDVPEEFPVRPYVIVDWLPSGPPEGSWADEDDMRDVMLQVQSVGDDQRQCAWMQEQVGKAWLQYGKTVPGCVGLWIDQLGGIVRVDDRTCNATDTYRMKVES